MSNGLNKIFSIPGYPASYIQVSEYGLKGCLANQTDQNVINSCIYQYVLAPSANNQLAGVSLWSGEQLPPNPACWTSNFNGTYTGASSSGDSTTPPPIIFAPKQTTNNKNVQNFQQVGSGENLTKQDNFTLIIIIVITLLIVLLK